jgi:hypothetical protein
MRPAIKPKYKVGQVVSLAGLDFYKSGKRKGEQFQKIIQVYPWVYRDQDNVRKTKGFGLRFKNGDTCHEKWVKSLTAKELGK